MPLGLLNVSRLCQSRVCCALRTTFSHDMCCVQVATVAKVNVGSGECDICKLVAGYLDKFVDNNSTEVCSPKFDVFEVSFCKCLISLFLCMCTVFQAEAKAAVEKICDIMGPVKSECEALVDTYFDQIWKMLENQLVGGVECVL